jgi:cytochrome c peroxidase
MLDGRADNLRAQVLVPLLDPAEMGNTNIGAIASRLRQAPYATELEALARAAHTGLVEAATAAVESFETEDPSFHPYSSRFDRFLRGTATLTPNEAAGFRLFSNPNKGNCIACHTAVSGPGGQPPVFTDHSYHALGVPRNPAIAANSNRRFFDMGLCGPKRGDLKDEHQYCGYFKTPSLRNVARRRFFFHNGRFTALEDVMHFYVERDTDPRRWYPANHGRVAKFDDLPARYRGNVNISDAPLNREWGQQPALNEKEIQQVIVFLGTLSDADQEPGLLSAGLHVDPLQVGARPRHYRESENLWILIRVCHPDKGFDGLVVGAPGLDHEPYFLGGLDHTLPAVSTDDVTRLHAGGQLLFDQHLRQLRSLLRVGTGRNDDDIVFFIH